MSALLANGKAIPRIANLTALACFEDCHKPSDAGTGEQQFVPSWREYRYLLMKLDKPIPLDKVLKHVG